MGQGWGSTQLIKSSQSNRVKIISYIFFTERFQTLKKHLNEEIMAREINTYVPITKCISENGNRKTQITSSHLWFILNFCDSWQFERDFTYHCKNCQQPTNKQTDYAINF